MFKNRFIAGSLCAVAFASASQQVSGALIASSVIVKGTDVPWLAGRTDFTIAPRGAAPVGYPFARDDSQLYTETFPEQINAAGTTSFQFSASGAVNLDVPEYTHNTTTPDGLGYYVTPGAVAGISGYDGPEGALLGVFLNNNNPQSATPPSTLNPGTSFLTLSPLIGQVFFIGDGLSGTGTGTAQTFNVPVGATRLFLGTVDVGYSGNAGNFDDNAGSYSVVATATAVPEPSIISASAVAGILLLGRRRRSAVVL